MPETPGKTTQRQRRRPWRRWLFAGVLLALCVTGCRSVSYYGQAVNGQMQLFAKRQSIDKILAQPDTRPALRGQLELVLAIREYAEEELKLKANGHYTDYADLGRPFVVWNVYAAPEFSLEPKKWWYPVVGSLKYRGFFSEEAAREYGAEVAKQGYDVHVGGVDAYSTLGWFKDPVLNTFVHHEPRELAELLFHELAHQRVFAAGDTDFNEAFATAVGEEGTRRWLAARGDAKEIAAYDQELRRKDQFVNLVMGAREQLKVVYGVETNHGPRAVASPGSQPLVDAKREHKQAVIDQLRRDYAALKESWGGYSGYDNWFNKNLNNAKLNTVATYYHLVPAFTFLLRKNEGDLQGFFADAEFLAHMTKETRKPELEKLLALARREPVEVEAVAAK